LQLVRRDLPGLERAHRAGFGVFAARQADLGPLPRLVSFAASDAQPEPAGDDGHILDLERHQFGAAQRAGEAEQQQGAITPAAGTRIAGQKNLPQHRYLPWNLAHRDIQGPLQGVLRTHGRPEAAALTLSLNRCIFSSADSRRRIVVGAWLSARLAR
jgi:hypothetical protein